MTALDQAFIKAYLLQAGDGNACRAPSESPQKPTSQQNPQPQQGELAGTGPFLGELSLRSAPEASSVLAAKGNQPGEKNPSGANGPGSAREIPDSSAKTASSGKRARRKSGQWASDPTRKKSAPRVRCLSLTEVLDEEDRQSSVGLPNRRTLQELASTRGPDQGTHPGVGGSHFLFKGARKRTVQETQIRPLRENYLENRSPTGQSDFPVEDPAEGQPEYILEFPGCLPQAEPRPPSEQSLRRQKVPKNPRKITLRDLEIPPELCFFEPPSPTIPLHEEPPNRKGRGVAELPQSLNAPRLSLFALESQQEACQEESSVRQPPGVLGGQTKGALAPPGKELQGQGGPERLLRLRPASEGGYGSQPNDGKGTKGQANFPAAQSPPATDSAPRSAGPGSRPFCPHWHVAAFRWPKVCLALEAKAPAALARVREAILSAAQEGKKVIGFASLQAGQGATTLVLCAAGQLAAQGCRVLLVEVNFRHPDLADQLNVAPQVGWEHLGEGCRSVQEVLIESQADKVTLLPWCDASGTLADQQPARLAALAESLKELRPWYDVILLDLGSLEEGQDKPTGDQTAPVCLVEAVVLVRNVRTGGGQADIGVLRQRLEAVGASVIGVVDNCV